MGKGVRNPWCWKPPFLALKNDTNYHERRKYEEIIYRKKEIFTLHKVLIRHDRTCVCVDRHTLSVLSLLQTFFPVLTYLYCRIIVCCTQRYTLSVTCNVKQLLWKHLWFYRIIATLFTNQMGMIRAIVSRENGGFQHRVYWTPLPRNEIL